MGYFSNGSEGMDYEAKYCDRCVHQNGPNGDSGCAVWQAHMANNYKECDKKDSILHLLIPRSKEGCNEECRMFLEGDAAIVSDVKERYEMAMREGL